MRELDNQLPLQRGTIRRIIAVFAAALMVTAFIVAAPAAQANTVDPSTFERGFIISDSKFYDGNAMTEAEIQSFLNAKIGTCNNSRCLNILTQDTYDRAADGDICGSYTGAKNESAARVIFKVQKSCGISAKVILVTLQKEMGLVTSKSPSQWSIDHALGYACSDSAPCDSTKAGFFNQIRLAAWQFKRYSVPSAWGQFRAGNTYGIQFHPNRACGTYPVHIKNRATAALYNYTPYTPTGAGFAAYPGIPDRNAACSSYGNRNFWYLYNIWFGNSTPSYPATVTKVERISGDNRFTTAIDISKTAFPDSGTASVVYIADGMNFPDALSAAPAAAKEAGPLLLVQQNSLPAVVKAEIVRLAAPKIVVVGGEGSVSAEVYAKLSELVAPGEIQRIEGQDRYATSREIARQKFPLGETTKAFIATGATFADALSASAVAGSVGAPVILVRGNNTTVDQKTRDLLQELGITEIFIAGGPAAVSSGLESSLNAVPGVTKVTRYGGGNRYVVSAATNKAFFSTSDHAYMASGTSFPDALAGAAMAGMKKVPLYLTPATCVYPTVIEGLDSFGTTKVFVLGGASVVGPRAVAFENCY